jgi:hypothetical protein
VIGRSADHALTDETCQTGADSTFFSLRVAVSYGATCCAGPRVTERTGEIVLIRSRVHARANRRTTPLPPHQNPTPEELYQAWDRCGEEKLGELLEQMTDEDEE